MIAHLRILSFVFSHVCVLVRSYTCVVVSCLGSCGCDAMLRVGDQIFLAESTFFNEESFIGCLKVRELG